MRKRPAVTGSAGKSNHKGPAMTFISAAPAQRAKAPANPHGIPVLPAVDVNLGTVTFFTPAGHRAYFYADPARLVPTGVRTVLVHGTADRVVPVGGVGPGAVAGAG